MGAESNVQPVGTPNTKWNTKPKVNLQGAGAHIADRFNPANRRSISQLLAFGYNDTPKGC